MIEYPIDIVWVLVLTVFLGSVDVKGMSWLWGRELSFFKSEG